jgi:hypothetical protein
MVPVDRESRAGTARPQASPTVAPILTAPLSGENLLLYIAATTHVISTTIMVERSKKGHAFGVQRPVYFVSEVLSESKVCYPSIQKLLHNTHHIQKAPPLLRRVPDLSCHLFPIGRYSPQSGHH